MKKLLNWYASCLLALIEPALKRYESQNKAASSTASDEMKQAIVNIMLNDLQGSGGVSNGGKR